MRNFQRDMNMTFFSYRLPLGAALLVPLVIIAVYLTGGTAFAQDGTPQTTVEVIGESTLDADNVVDPSFFSVNFEGLSTASHTVSVSWIGTADVRFDVFDETTGNQLNVGVVQGNNPGVWTADLIGGQPYSIHVWAFTGVADVTVSIETSVPPGIDQQPVDLTISEGEEAVFAVLANGTGTLSYQWFADEVPITDATSSTLTISDALPAASGCLLYTSPSPRDS